MSLPALLAVVVMVVAAGPAAAQSASLVTPPAVAPGARIEIRWQGPDAPGDFVAIADPKAPASGFVAYARTSKGDPAVLTAPAAGDYEVRYVAGAGLAILARAPLSVGAAPAANLITAPPRIEAGADLSVAIADPGDPADYVTIAAAGSPDDALGPYAWLRGGTEVALAAPDRAGAYEIRLIQAASQTVLARAPLEVLRPEPPVPATAPADLAPAGSGDGVSAASEAAAPDNPVPVTLMALVAVDRATAFHVAVSGPGGEGDRVAVVAWGGVPEAPPDGGTVAEASSVGLTAPDAPGAYEIVYVDGASGDVLARRDLEVR